ncbi:protein phosphatase 2A, regulatory subunit [Tritrichomonas foetus]|uniref:Protein phosphatase 2A, regulatory subunit n=1 Tax=Tritrichomonas foetus TaxID=1144522 RepID=A0A1J4JI46_9EUKA|nr:protein phosphatase 2A, regulatory subunit [Tritrichomonas foetus]|eukprot:OHS98842.1 protein phosphatase 2A, regulatory subunit [Tritrichomonas foetus]
MASKLRGSFSRPPGILQPKNRTQPASNQNKKTILKPIPPKQNTIPDNESEKQPISDFPSPPVQIVSCRHGQAGDMIPLPQISTAPIGEIPQLAIQKLKQCQRICDFSDVNADAASKVTKKATLNELIDLYSNPKLSSRLTRECHQQVIETFATNVFRPPPNIPRALLVSDEVTIEDTAWPHLQLVYLMFLKFLDCNVELRILQYQLQPKFISNLFAVLDFPDERERVQARAVIGSIYNKVPPHRNMLMNITLNLLMSVPEDLELNAASHLLELFYQFTSNTPPPLSQQLVQAFERVLLPLHLPYRCQRYFPPLVRCILLMIRKDARLANNLLQFLIGHWPLTLDHKSELFIDEIGQMLDEANPQDLNDNIVQLISCVLIAAESPCMTLADKALKFMLNNRVQNLIVENPDTLLNIIFPPLFRVACSHWQRSLQLNALNVMNTFMELCPDAFRRAAERFKASTMMENARKMQKKGLWDSVALVASQNDRSINSENVNLELTAFFGVNRYIPRNGSQPFLNIRGRTENEKMLTRSMPVNMLPTEVSSVNDSNRDLQNPNLNPISNNPNNNQLTNKVDEENVYASNQIQGKNSLTMAILEDDEGTANTASASSQNNSTSLLSNAISEEDEMKFNSNNTQNTMIITEEDEENYKPPVQNANMAIIEEDEENYKPPTSQSTNMAIIEEDEENYHPQNTNMTFNEEDEENYQPQNMAIIEEDDEAGNGEEEQINEEEGNNEEEQIYEEDGNAEVDGNNEDENGEVNEESGIDETIEEADEEDTFVAGHLPGAGGNAIEEEDTFE